MSSYDLLVATTGAGGLAVGGSIVFTYPSTAVRGNYVAGGEVLSIPSRQAILTDGFTVTYGETSAVVVYAGAGAIPRDTLLRLQVGYSTYVVPDREPTPVPQLRRMAFVGDSVIAATILQDSTFSTFNVSRGPSFWATFLTNQRVATSKALNFGVSGDTTNMVIDRLAPIVDAKADIYYVAIGTNNIGSKTWGQTVADLETIWSALLATGAIVIAQTILPRTLATQSSRDFLWRVNRWIRMQAGTRPRLYIVDPALNYGDPAAADASPRTNYAYDGLHPTTLGAYFATKPLAALLNSLVPDVLPSFVGASDVYSVDNPEGNLLTNGALAGTAGTLGGGGGTISGTVADSWTLNTSANGGTVTSLVNAGSKTTLADGRVAQHINLSGTYTGAGSATVNNSTLVLISQDIVSFANYSVGDRLQLTADIAVAVGAANVASIEAFLLATIGGQNYTFTDGASMGDRIPAEAYSGSLKTPVMTLVGTPTLIRCALRVYLRLGANTPALDLDIASMCLRKVAI